MYPSAISLVRYQKLIPETKILTFQLSEHQISHDNSMICNAVSHLFEVSCIQNFKLTIPVCIFEVQLISFEAEKSINKNEMWNTDF